MVIRRLTAIVLVASVASAVAAPPQVVDARIIKIEVQRGPDLVVTVGAGNVAGLDSHTTCEVLDDRDQVISRRCEVVRVDKRATTCKIIMRDPRNREPSRVRFTTP